MPNLKLLPPKLVVSLLMLACLANTTPNRNKDTAAKILSTVSGDDMYYELTSTSIGKHLTINGVTKMYVSSKGNMRVEMNYNNSMASARKTNPIVLIGHCDKPDESISIDDSSKTYTVNHIDNKDLNDGKKFLQSTATKIGEEKISGFNAVHAKIITTNKGGRIFSQSDTIDLWRSDEVPMQPKVKELFDKFQSGTGSFMYTPETENQLKQMGCKGFMVKLVMHGNTISMTMQLTKAEHRNLPTNLFQVPAGYKENKSDE